MENAGELDVDEELDARMRAVLIWLKMYKRSRSYLIVSKQESFISCVSVTYLLYCLVMSCLSCFLYIYKHNYGAIVLRREGCRAISGLQILFWTKVYIFLDSLLSKQRTTEYTFRPHQTVPGHYHIGNPASGTLTLCRSVPKVPSQFVHQFRSSPIGSP